mmetsp:Transcript_94625/g.276609  ORF Transcript_94625/g.276609 Transcript_94625/m.276609 type:complete len:348 (-) Transcript_94625:528-1571(-)
MLGLHDLQLTLQLLQLLLCALHLIDQLALLFVLCQERSQLLPCQGEFLLRLFEPSLRGPVTLLGQRLDLYLQLVTVPLQPVDPLGPRGELHADLRAGLIKQVHSLVWQESSGDVAVGELGCRHKCSILDADTMVGSVAVPQPPQDCHGRLRRGLRHRDLLETPLQCSVLLNVLAILVQRGGTNAPQLAPRKHRLQQIGCIHGTVRLPSADKKVHFVDEEYHPALSRLDLLQHGLEALLKLTPVLRAADQSSDVQRHDSTGLQGLWHVTDHDALCQTLHDRSLPDTGLTYDDGVVLGPARQDLDHPPDLVVAPNYRVELPRLTVRHEIVAVLCQCFETGVTRGALHLL